MAYCWLKQRGSVWWLFYAKEIGRKPESLRTSDKAFAQEVQRRRESEIFMNAQGITERRIPRIAYSDLMRRFLEHKLATVREDKTIRDYNRILNRFGEFLRADVPIGQITIETLEAYVVHRRNSTTQNRLAHGEERKLGQKTVNNEVFTIVDLFKFAKSRNLIANDPSVDLKKPKKVSYDAPRCLTVEEFLALKKAIQEGAYLKDLRKDKRIDPEEFSDIVDFYLLTGIRRSDGPSITSDNFNFERMIATLPQHKQGTTKSIPIGRDLEEVVRRMIARAGERTPLVRCHVNSLTYNFALARAKAALPPSITFHSLRHTFISWLASLGTDIKTVQTLAGHQSLESTRMYLHTFDTNKRTAIEKLVLPKAKAG